MTIKNKQLLKDALIWGFVLWLIGYLLGMVFFFIFPPAIMGWFIMPIGLTVILFVLFKKIKSREISYYFILGAVWMVMAAILDYIFIVKMLNPAGSYYKLDVYIYYILTLTVPPLTGWWKKKKR